MTKGNDEVEEGMVKRYRRPKVSIGDKIDDGGGNDGICSNAAVRCSSVISSVSLLVIRVDIASGC